MNFYNYLFNGLLRGTILWVALAMALFTPISEWRSHQLTIDDFVFFLFLGLILLINYLTYRDGNIK